ncbi:MAG: STAS domain-containing protein [Acidimicrobiia bacterium]|nr:STAS domain-containing protein [Acidimicrobiia bacterium]
MQSFGAYTSRTNGSAVVSVRGDVDVYTAPYLWETINAAMAETPHELVVDLTGAPFVDSSGLSVLVRAQRRLRPVEGTLVVRGANKRVSMTLQLTKLNTVLTVER